MKILILSLATLFTMNAFAVDKTGQVSGEVTLKKGLEKSLSSEAVLFVFAKKAGVAAGNGAMPIAVLRVPQPKFPYKFNLTAANVMAPGTPFEGPFSLYARLSPSGDAMDKSGPQGESLGGKKGIQNGQKDVKIELKAK